MEEKVYDRNDEEPVDVLEEFCAPYGLRTYVSLFSSAGVGCYGFKQENFRCVATVELLEKRLKIQRYNKKCLFESGYICGDMTEELTQLKIIEEVNKWKTGYKISDVDVLIATPPCQGMSVANHKKKDELGRNSLVVESIRMTLRLNPRFFIFENVRAFLNSVCTDLDGAERRIGDAIMKDLAGKYNILARVVNFKDFGCPSSRTRTLIIGVRRDQTEVTPYDLFPDRHNEMTLRKTIGHLPSLTTMGEICESDIYHSFKSYTPEMMAWVENLKEGQSAFDNVELSRIPHTVKDGVIVYNARKNGDKYTRQRWDAVAPCVHTRNDIMASQNTIHPADNRVFSIRELMLMMSIPDSFVWSDIPFDSLNQMTLEDKKAFLKKEEINIRQNIGEAVPTVVFRQIANKIRKYLCRTSFSDVDIKRIIDEYKLTSKSELLSFISKDSVHTFEELARIAELSNAKRTDTAAYYTRQDICYSVIEGLPDAKGYKKLRILEPSVGVGNFLPALICKYADVLDVSIDVVDIDQDSIDIITLLLAKINVPRNVKINYICADFLLYDFKEKYDIVVGNPPYKKLTNDPKTLCRYKLEVENKETNNIFSFFIEKAIRLASNVALIVPKSLINAPEFNKTRELLSRSRISRLTDYGEKAFKGVKIETVSFVVQPDLSPSEVTVVSYITNEVRSLKQNYMIDRAFPCWIIYRDDKFDEVAKEMDFNVFKVYRDRSITKSQTCSNGRFRVLKSRNIGDNRIIDIPNYDTYIDSLSNLDVAKYLDRTNCVLLPNLTYKPRACFMPSGCIADGSVAILTPIDVNSHITKSDLAFYATDIFAEFYSVARNRGSRSLNIDNNSVFFLVN